MGMSLADLRFDHPKTFWTSSVAMAVGTILAAFLLLPSNGFFEAAGVNGAQRRVIALKNAVYWYTRSYIHASSKDLHFETRFGNVIRFDDALYSSIPSGEAFEDVRHDLADVVVTSAKGADQIVQGVRFKDAKFEVYGGDKAVVWIDGKPLNITLIEAGAAKPDPDPPTNIVDLAFASYYWNQFKGEAP